MSLPDRKEAEVRRLLEQRTAESVPPDLAERARTEGERLLGRRRALRTALWAGALVGLAALLVWALALGPWTATPPTTTSPTAGW
ncbi:hypothetical protein [Streptomyces reniochalinae]|uniref:DUF3040 domain-containing protein n=1 Tax=Streptomyces reniochalinae TaxID=2250578 RepID=A0A367EPP2_9ACTN|nr:hypothetical protein [Streptomyces reniochalinae]RCG19377.1 hypothetical protein DQ392_12060 [Streptomyces reniochalinae]